MKIDSEKIEAISYYLQEHFPSAEHADKDDFARIGHMFRITTKEHVMLAVISREFMEDNNLKTILSTLAKIDISKLLKDNPKSTVIITSHGPRITERTVETTGSGLTF